MEPDRCRRTIEEVLLRHIEGETTTVEDSKLLAAAFLISMKDAKDHLAAAAKLAETTAQTARWMKWLAIMLVFLSLLQIVITLFVR